MNVSPSDTFPESLEAVAAAAAFTLRLQEGKVPIATDLNPN